MIQNTTRNLNENGELLLKEGEWQLEEYPDDNGPVIYHKPCKMWTVELNRKYPECISCGASMPSSMIATFTLMNWQHADDPEYFIQFGYEDEGHERAIGVCVNDKGDLT